MSERFAAADGIRGLACLLVVSTHAIVIIATHLSSGLIGVPKVGVWLFFVLSAFLLTYKFSIGGFSMPIISKYFLGRALRILPIYFIFVVFYWLFGTANIDSVHDVVRSFLMEGAYAHLWTIPVEFKYYALLPALAWILVACKERFGLVLGVLLGLALLVVEQELWPYWLTPKVTSDTRWYLSCFTVGSISAIAFDFLRGKFKSIYRDAVGLFVLVGVACSAPAIWCASTVCDENGYLINKFVYFSIAFSVFILALIDGEGVVGGFLKGSFLSLIGRCSFSIYLIHWFFVMRVSLYFEGSYLAVFISIFCSLLAGYLVYRYVELPIENFRHRLASR
ncbi:acyltransferase family protein [Pseudomonas graminis]|uniref:Peptidoglycan/LPS O-acetylase OafA/YrhL, contains acyltransferase and SGNH-hydrolase domains n=1 Tax=Pseudomonas graminis TaxID=158627 RepID=A0A1I0GZ66_9PSED|nr:acyltransferase [Pseudomonas graminis]SET76730.1 Peptidoglycan/LPS O-acetylase OafA/YrhL, contains acyltransferase and SGNH-hydrolase domains [Pseudomonas graminis]